MAGEIRILTIGEKGDQPVEALLDSTDLTSSRHPTFYVEKAGASEEGLSLLQDRDFDVVLLHDAEPGNLISDIRALSPGTAIIILHHQAEEKLSPPPRSEGADSELWLPEISGTMLGQALQDAVEKRLLQQSLENARRELDHRVAEFRSIRQASLHLTSSLELQSALDAILENALHLISADDAHIFLYQEGELHFGAALFEGGQQKEPFQNPREHGITYTVARSGEKLVVDDVMNHPIFEDRRWDGAIISIPLKIRDEVQGVMNLAFEHPHKFTEDEQRALELIADQAAIAIHNARLYEKAQREIQERKQAEEALRESEERYRKLFDSSKDAIMTLEPPAWNFTSGNNAILDMFKVSTIAEFTSHSPGDLSPPTQPDGSPSKEKAREMIHKALQEGSHFFEWTHQRKNGETFPATVLLTRVDLADKQFLQATVRDITERKATERSLRESEEKYRSLFERVPVGLYQTTPEGKIMDANPALVEMLKYPDRESLLGVKVSDIFVDKESRQAQVSLLEEEEVLPDYELRLHCHDGSIIWVKDSARAVKNPQGEVLFYQGSLVDITERVLLQREVEERRSYLEVVLSSTPSALITLDKEHRVLDWNMGAENLFGYTAQEAVGNDLDHLIASPDGEVLHEAADYTNQVLSREIVPLTETVRYDKWGRPFHVLLTGAPIEINGDLVGIVASYTDISKQKKLEKEIKHMATHDALTGLPNRRLFNERITLEMAHAERDKEMLSVMLLDLDGFKEVNDTFGHSTGDRILTEIGQRLEGVLRKSDTVARMGGDEFLLIIPQMQRVEDASITADRILEAIRAPFEMEGKTISLSFSIGIAIYPTHGEDVDSLTKHADRAMYVAKDKGGDTYQIYSPS